MDKLPVKWVPFLAGSMRSGLVIQLLTVLGEHLLTKTVLVALTVLTQLLVLPARTEMRLFVTRPMILTPLLPLSAKTGKRPRPKSLLTILTWSRPVPRISSLVLTVVNPLLPL